MAAPSVDAPAGAVSVAVRDLSIEYSSGGYRVRPIDHLDLDIAEGELVLALGASGCGKTTLLSALASILSPTSGSIRLRHGGRDIEVTALRGAELTEYRRRSVGIVFQAFNLVPSLTAVENVAAPLLVSGVGRRQAMAKASELLTQVDLADRLGHRPGDLSGGQQQRVAIARALAAEPPLVLADEPTAHLDYVQVDGVLRLLRSLAGPGRIVVVATHDERLLPLADRILELSPRMAATGGAAQPKSLDAGEVLFRQGDAGDLVYTVESGTVEVVRERVDGPDEVVARYGPGQYFGELAPLYGLRRSATARAVEPSAVVGHPPSEFRHLAHAADGLPGPSA
jgi:putative ABC transport system ATP-binding protein